MKLLVVVTPPSIYHNVFQNLQHWCQYIQIQINEFVQLHWIFFWSVHIGDSLSTLPWPVRFDGWVIIYQSSAIRGKTTGSKGFPYTCHGWWIFLITSLSVFFFKNWTAVNPVEMRYSLLWILHNYLLALLGSIIELERCEQQCVKSSCLENNFGKTFVYFKRDCLLPFY